MRQIQELYPGKQIFITEFGFSDKQGKRRPYWILETIRYVIGALNAGVAVKGILLWTLVNNFEWELGMDQKFGLFDELDLDKQLEPSQESEIQSWEAWRAVTNAIRSPSLKTLGELETCYDRAKRQFEQATV